MFPYLGNQKCIIHMKLFVNPTFDSNWHRKTQTGENYKGEKAFKY